MFAYGAQYYRPPTPSDDWDEDLQRMSELGFNTVKVWSMWNADNPSENELDFTRLAEVIEKASTYDLEIHISVILENAPHWLAQQHPEARYEDQNGVKIGLQGRANTPSGGWPGLCLNNRAVREPAEQYMRALGERFADTEAVTHYATWDESFFEPNRYYPNKRFCYCDACETAFRTWLQDKYENLESLNENWKYHLSEWKQVKPPRYFGEYPRYLDWLRFRLHNHQHLMRWRAEVMSEATSDATIRAHGIGGNLGDLATRYNDDWRSATTVEEWGTSAFPGTTEGIVENDGIMDEVVRHHITLDVARGAARGGRFWQTELQGGPLTGGSATDPQGLSRGATPSTEELALWNWNALMAGANGILYWQYRPELLGPESPGFGLVRRNGEPTERARVAERFANLIPRHPELAAAQPERSNLAIGLLPEAPLFNYVAEQNTNQFSETVWGGYRSFWEANFQVDFAKPQQFESYDVVYLPFPVLLEPGTARAITSFVKRGGTLITDGAPAVYDENGHLFRDAPGYGLNEVFGARLASTRRSGDEVLELPSCTLPSASRRDIFHCEEAMPIGRWSDGGVGAVRNEFHDGVAIALGTLSGRAHLVSENDHHRAPLCSVATEEGLTPRVRVDRQYVIARLHEGDGVAILYVINLSEHERSVNITIERDFGPLNATIGDIEHDGSDETIAVSITGHGGGAMIWEAS